MTDSGCLNRKHWYYTQVQGQLLVTGQSFRDFFIWTPSSHKLERIYPDTHLWEKLEKTDLVFCYLRASRDFDWQNKASCRKQQ